MVYMYKVMMMDGFILVGYLMLAAHQLIILNKHQLQAKSPVEMNCMVGGSGPQSHPPNQRFPEMVKPPQPESVNQKQSYVHRSSDVTIQPAFPGSGRSQ